SANPRRFKRSWFMASLDILSNLSRVSCSSRSFLTMSGTSAPASPSSMAGNALVLSSAYWRQCFRWATPLKSALVSKPVLPASGRLFPVGGQLLGDLFFGRLNIRGQFLRFQGHELQGHHVQQPLRGRLQLRIGIQIVGLVE